jgi:D-threonate/D-erythronate kinase
MIAVVADDLTGAAEIGGIGLNHGLTVEISTRVHLSTTAGLLVIATDTRSKSEAEAVETMEQITKDLLQLNPAFIFKKVDSVLRGYVVPEISAHLRALGLEKALLVPANPALGRTIENGVYLINGTPISETAFSADPEFPAKDSDVLKLLKAGAAVQVRKYSNSALENGITVAEVKSEDDLYQWAQSDLKDVFPAGASGFFKAVLKTANLNSEFHSYNNEVLSGLALYVIGSAFAKSEDFVKELQNAGAPVSYLPESIINDKSNKNEFNIYCDAICNLINRYRQAIIAIDSQTVGSVSASELRAIMASIVKQVFSKVQVNELIIEGGSTASAVLNDLKIESLEPVHQYATGVIRSKVIGTENLYVTLKPGSYNWPNQVLSFSNLKIIN